MNLRVGFELVFSCMQRTPMLLMLNTHASHANEVIVPDRLRIDRPLPLAQYYDSFGNLCSRIVTPSNGYLTISTEALLNVSERPEQPGPDNYQSAVEHLPDECMQFLLGSRYCETDLLSETAWAMFGNTPQGRARVQAICDYVHHHIVFDYQQARPTRTAFETYREGAGVCRDYAHLAIALCRAMNIPARYCSGYISDVGLPPPYAPMDFCAWFEAYLGDRWQTFDPRNNAPRTGRVLMARGRDAADVALSNAFGAVPLVKFAVICEPQ
ncbi:transglutaminase family protein [Paraburkholderia sp. DHOC27]|uniref:transglutaminase-like domain-containing protein n=1 Tax=Paraburkholderia sp. DHOC27 TaxID=2303330 RepID=UPI000E3DFB95|nr:transglutaminase family protein [Paraburkholderia sp. DHOC27]RFU48369.1 transglutaminase family protein [Paraburkholderia sp. DHOC27]